MCGTGEEGRIGSYADAGCVGLGRRNRHHMGVMLMLECVHRYYKSSGHTISE